MRLREAARGRNFCEHNEFMESLAGYGVLIDGTGTIQPDSFTTMLMSGLQTGLNSFKQLWQAAVVIQLFLLGMVGSFFFIPATQNLFTMLIELKVSMGIWFGFWGMGMSVGLLAELLKVYTVDGGKWKADNLRNIRFNFLVFGSFGILSHYKFNFIENIFSGLPSGWSLLCKTVFDMVIYSACFYNPLCVLILALRHNNFSLAKTYDDIGSFRDFLGQRIIPTQVTHWMLWVPMCPLIFLMPVELQLPIVTLAVTFWVMLLTIVNSKKA